MGRSVRLLLLAVAAAEPRRRLLVVDFSRSARTDYGLDAALRHRNLREVFPDVDYLDIESARAMLAQHRRGARDFGHNLWCLYVLDRFLRRWIA